MTWNKHDRRNNKYNFVQLYLNLHFSQSKHTLLYFKLSGSILCSKKQKEEGWQSLHLMHTIRKTLVIHA